MTDPVAVEASPQGIAYDPGRHWQWRYWSIFAGQAFSLIGSALTQFVLLWWITDTTGSVSALATAGVFALLPQALIGPLGGTLADRWSRRAIMICSDAISALCMLVLIALFLTENVALWHLYTMMFVRSAMQAFQQPAATASTPMLVPEHFLTRAAGLNQTLFGIMTIAAAPLGALAIGLMPIGWALSIDVITALLGILPLIFFAIPQIKSPAGQKTSLWIEFREGISTVWNHRGLRELYALLGASVLIVMPSFTLVPLLIKEHFLGGPTQVAWIECFAGIGMILGGALTTAINPVRRVPWILWGFTFACVTIALTALSPTNYFWAASFWWGISGMSYIMANGPFTALLQSTIPNQLQGRVMSLLSTIMGLGAPLGLAIAIPLGDYIGVRGLFIVVGLAGGAISLLGFLSPSIRKLDTPNQ